MNRYFRVVPLLGIVTTLTLQSQPVLALERSQVAAIAKSFTVRIEGQETTGTGTIIKQEGNTYTILTCWHVVNAEGGFEVTTVDNRAHQVTSVKNLENDIDLAILQFTSTNPYEVATLGDSAAITEGINSYVVGYPDPIPGLPDRAYTFQNADIISFQPKGEKGYQIVHNNPTTQGSSGGGIFDNEGNLIGINGRTTSDAEGRAYYGLAIPLEIYLAAQTSFTTPTTINPPQDFVSLGQRKLKQEDYQGAIADFDRALASNPNDLDALSGRAKAYYWLKDFDAAIQDFDAVLQRNPNNATFFFYRGYAYEQLKERQKAIADYTEAIRLDPDYALAYNNRGANYGNLGEYDKAIADFNQALRLDPDYADAYYNRGNSYSDLGEYGRAIADYTEALRLDPEKADVYYYLGLISEKRGNKQKALEDFQQAADLYLQQGNTEWYQNALDKIRKLQ